MTKMWKLCGTLTLVAVSSFYFPERAQAQKKVVFVAGPKDHGRPGNGRHEYEKSLNVLKHCLENSANSKKVTAQLYTAQWPKAEDMKDAAVVVLNSSGDRIPREWHAMFPQDAITDHKTYDEPTMERIKQFDALMKKGVGLVALHYTTWVNNETGRKYWLDWLGGVADYGQDDSKVKVTNWSVTPVTPKHAILKGIEPWSYQEEFFLNQLMPADARRTPLLSVAPAAGGDSSVISWAVERKGGGRGFVFTGNDFYKNMLHDQHRRVLANAILWAAKVDVPNGGVQCTVPENLLQ